MRLKETFGLLQLVASRTESSYDRASCRALRCSCRTARWSEDIVGGRDPAEGRRVGAVAAGDGGDGGDGGGMPPAWRQRADVLSLEGSVWWHGKSVEETDPVRRASAGGATPDGAAGLLRDQFPYCDAPQTGVRGGRRD